MSNASSGIISPVTIRLASLLAICSMTLVAAALRPAAQPAPADLLVTNARIYTLTWSDPTVDGIPAANAPLTNGTWRPDREALAITGDRIVFTGTSADAARLRGPKTRVIDAAGATIVPGLIDAHVHIAELGASLERVNLVGVRTEDEAIARVVERAQRVPKGEWIVGWGWDEGAWASRYPTMAALSARVPDHPVLLRGLHTFASWGNRLAFERAGITASTPTPEGGEIAKDAGGQPTGVLLNTATQLLARAIPAPTADQLDARVLAGLRTMAECGYVAVHEAGADTALMQSLERLERARRLPIRVYAMLSARDEPLLATWRARGPMRDVSRMLVTRAVKSFDDGALGSRGARLLADYSDRPGHRGISREQSELHPDRLRDMMGAGFQIVVHAIGDGGNRETLDFFEQAFREHPAARSGRHRIEHAQVLHPDDVPRFAALGILASMQPGHAVEDKAWAEDRLGAARVNGAYAWRTLRRAGARLVFSSDLPGSDYHIFYMWHSAVTRQDPQHQPPGGWHPRERMTIEEAIRGYTTWAAYSAFEEDIAGTLAPGRRADFTMMDIDPFAVGSTAPERLLEGAIGMTVAGGRVVYEKR
jgi:predicted amidohydrolase YtcJ